MAGRRPKPTHLKVVAGNPGKRALPKDEPQPERQIPSAPAHLSDKAKVAWGMYCVILDRIGVLTEADGGALVQLCEAEAEVEELRAQIRLDGRTFKTTSTAGDIVIKANPAVAMLDSAVHRLRAYQLEFGLTPAARTKVHTVKSNGKPEPKEKPKPAASYF